MVTALLVCCCMRNELLLMLTHVERGAEVTSRVIVHETRTLVDELLAINPIACFVFVLPQMENDKVLELDVTIVRDLESLFRLRRGLLHSRRRFTLRRCS